VVTYTPVSSGQLKEPFAWKPVGAANHQGTEQAVAAIEAALVDLVEQLAHPWRPPMDLDAAIPQALAELPILEDLPASGSFEQDRRRDVDLVVLHGWLLGGLDAERLTDLSQIGRDALQRVVPCLSQGGAAASRCATTPATPPDPWYHPTEQPP
jgi:hypothetical protein